MSVLASCLGRVAPLYNLAMVVIVVILFVKLFHQHSKKVYITPWKLIFAAVCIYVIEQVIAILEQAGMVVVSGLLFPLFEMVIIAIFIYVLLLQKEYVEK